MRRSLIVFGTPLVSYLPATYYKWKTAPEHKSKRALKTRYDVALENFCNGAFDNLCSVRSALHNKNWKKYCILHNEYILCCIHTRVEGSSERETWYPNVHAVLYMSNEKPNAF